jgi:tetratricopeptide (TPR) repeat protein
MKYFLNILIFLMSVNGSSQGFFDPGTNPVLRKGNEAYENKDYQLSGDYFNSVLKREKENHIAHFNLGNTYYKKGAYDSAITHYSAAQQYAPNDEVKSKAHYNLGNAMLKKKEYQKAIDEYKKSLKLNPEDEDARYNLSYAKKMIQQQQQQQQQEQNKEQKNENQQQQQQQQQKDQQKDKEQKKDQPQPQPKNHMT